MWYTKTKSIKQGRNKKVSYMMFNKFMQKNPLNVCGGGGGYGNLDLLKISLALLIVLRHIGQKFFCANTFWHVYIINTISTIGVTSFFIMSGFLLFKKTVNRERLRKAPFLLLNADAVFDVDFNRMVRFHQEHSGLVTLFTHPNNHPYDSGLIIAEKDMSVQSWLAKEDVRPTYYKNRVNAGLHVIDPKVLDMVAIDADKIGTVDKTTGKTVKVDLDRQLLKPLAGTGKMFCYDSPEYVKDMGTPDRFHQVEEDFKAGRVSAKNLSNKQKAVFLDRDGTINKYVGFLRNINDFELIDGVAEAIKKINASGYLAIVVTNQPVVARGEVAFQELEEIHNKMETELGLQGAYLDAIYYCPHHPHKGYEGEVPELKIECDCRKPKPGMLLKAADDYNIDLSQSYMIGDGENDIKAGLAAGCKAILVNGAGTDAKNEDFGQADTLSSVLEFVDKYLQ